MTLNNKIIAMKQKIFPSVMANSQSELDFLLNKLKGIATCLHLDIADGKFVPSTSLWFSFKLPPNFKYQVHLMVDNPEKWIEQHGKKVDMFFFHPESLKSTNQIVSVIKTIKRKNKMVGIALNPETTIFSVKNYLPDVDCALILTVHPGFYGRRFIKYPLQKIRQIKKINHNIPVIVDGGMNPKTITGAVAAGADGFISGSFVSKSSCPQAALRKLRTALS